MTHRMAREVCLALAFALFVPACASAQDSPARLRWDAFGSLAAVYHGAEGIEYRRNWEQPHGAEAHELEFGTDSVLGGQVTGRVLEGVDLSVQAVSRLHADNSWSPQITRAFLRMEPDESVMIRLGQVGVESQLDAESRYIGYAYLSIRPAQELMASVPTEYLVGGDVKYSHPLAGGVASVKGFYGTAHGKLNANGIEASLGETLTRGLILGFESEHWQGRVYAGVSTIQDAGASQSLIEALRALPVPGALAAANALDYVGAKVHYQGIDLVYTDGPIRLQGAHLKTYSNRSEVLLPTARNYALLAGYRIGNTTPYIQYGRAMRDLLSVPALQVPQLDGAIAAAIAGNRMDQSTVGVGLRYEMCSNAALKFQLDRISARDSSIVLDAGHAAGTPKAFTLLSASLDFAF